MQCTRVSGGSPGLEPSAAPAAGHRLPSVLSPFVQWRLTPVLTPRFPAALRLAGTGGRPQCAQETCLICQTTHRALSAPHHHRLLLHQHEQLPRPAARVRWRRHATVAGIPAAGAVGQQQVFLQPQRGALLRGPTPPVCSSAWPLRLPACCAGQHCAYFVPACGLLSAGIFHIFVPHGKSCLPSLAQPGRCQAVVAWSRVAYARPGSCSF